MATRRKRRSTRRRVHARARRHNPVNPVNPTHRRRRSTRRRRHSVFARRRRNPVNPVRHHRRRIGRRRHHRNPFGGGGEVLDFVGAGIGLGLFQPFVARFVGPYASALGAYSGPAITAFSGWALSKVLEMFGMTRRFAKAARILGYSTAIIQVVQPIVARTVGGIGGGGQGMGRGVARGAWGMNGIGIMTNIPPGYALPPAAQANARGMQGVGVMTNVPPGYAR